MTRNDEQNNEPGFADTTGNPSPIGTTASTEVARWADVAMYSSKPIRAQEGPKVTLLSAPCDPLGLIAAQAATYEGKFYNELSEITDDERRRFLADMQLTKLAMPLESVLFNFSIEGVTRGFTHQMVRQRTAAYAQESQRFAVVEDSFTDRVALPPELMGAQPLSYWQAEAVAHVDSSWGHFPRDADRDQEITFCRDSLVEQYGTPEDKLRYRWEKSVLATQENYKYLVDNGLAAESARGLLPTNITTRIKYNTSLRALLDHAGNRLCTQAQFEWRGVFFQIAQAIREYGKTVTYQSVVKSGPDAGSMGTRNSWWQFEEISKLFKPVCYQVGHCPMKASFDRKCSIRDRVDTFAANNIPSSCWEQPLFKPKGDGAEMIEIGKPIFPAEWLLNPAAAR